MNDRDTNNTGGLQQHRRCYSRVFRISNRRIIPSEYAIWHRRITNEICNAVLMEKKKNGHHHQDNTTILDDDTTTELCWGKSTAKSVPEMRTSAKIQHFTAAAKRRKLA